jgi:transposase
MKQPTYFIGLDVHKKKTTYVVRDNIGTILNQGETTTQYTDLLPILHPYLKKGIIGLEASTSYYSLYKQFQKNGYTIKVANTVQLRQLITKNDKLDAKRLADMLRLGTFPCSYIPDENIQHLREFIQIRHTLIEEKTRCKNRIHAILDKHHTIILPATKPFGIIWKKALQQYIASNPISLELRHSFDHYCYLEQKTNQINQELIGYTKKNWKDEHHLLQSITGIGPILSCYLIANIHPITRFDNKRKLRRYAGVIPVFKQSGEHISKGHLPKTSSRKLLRWALIQAANTIAKTQTPLGSYYRRKKKQKKNTGIAKVAVASSLIDIIYKVLTTKEPYQQST